MSGGLSVKTITKKWGHGIVKSEMLYFDDTGLSGLAKYMCKGMANKKRFQSKNLIQPKEA